MPFLFIMTINMGMRSYATEGYFWTTKMATKIAPWARLLATIGQMKPSLAGIVGRTPEEVEAFFVEHDGAFYNRVNPLNLMANKDERVVLLLDCVEGRLKCPMGSAIGYEKSAKTKSGWNCWCIDDADKTLIEKDGVSTRETTS